MVALAASLAWPEIALDYLMTYFVFDKAKQTRKKYLAIKCQGFIAKTAWYSLVKHAIASDSFNGCVNCFIPTKFLLKKKKKRRN